MDEQTGLELTAENVDTVLGEIRPYLIGTGGGGLEMVDMDGPIVKVRYMAPQCICTVLMRMGSRGKLLNCSSVNQYDWTGSSL